MRRRAISADLRIGVAQVSRLEVCFAVASVMLSLMMVEAVGQERVKIARVGYLGQAPAASFAPRVEAFRMGLRDLGYLEGRNLILDFRWAESTSQMPELAAELIRAGAEVLFAPSSTETGAALRVTKTVPVVFGAHADPVGVGHVTSLAHPGGNATGMTMLLTDLVAKELEVLKEALPGATRFGVLFASTAPSHVPAVEAAEVAAQSLGVQLRKFPVQKEDDFQHAFPAMVEDRIDGFMVLATPLMLTRRGLIAELAIKHRLPSVFGTKDNVLGGGLMSYAPDASALTRRAATYIDGILKGASPANLPVEQATRYELVVNLKTAKALNLPIPPTLLARADEVIE
jgi:putative tryptophan/tyrosine transport system substrate-binding protein